MIKIVKIFKNIKLYWGVLFILLSVLTYRHFAYIYSLSPMMRDFYTNIGNYERIGEWTLDSQETAEKYFYVNMPKNEALKIMGLQNCQISTYPYKPKEYEENLSCFKIIKGEFFGIFLPFFNNFKITISLDMNDKKIVRINSSVNIETIYG